MATLGEVAAGLSGAASRADEASAALTEAGQLAVEATELISHAMHGTGSLDDEFRQVVAQWSEVADRLAELVQHLGMARTRIEQHIRSLLGETDVADAPWADRARPQLPAYVTSGFYRDEDGNSDLVQSGRELSGEDQAIARHLIDQGLARPRGSATVSQHVEAKVAWRMRNARVQRAQLVLNNVVCEGPLSCTELLPDILLPGQTLTVHDPVQSHVFSGRTAQ